MCVCVEMVDTQHSPLACTVVCVATTKVSRASSIVSHSISPVALLPPWEKNLMPFGRIAPDLVKISLRDSSDASGGEL